MPLSANINLSIIGALVAGLDLETVKSDLAKKFQVSLTDGSGAGQATNWFSDSRVLAASGSESLDLAGVLSNNFGPVTFTKIKALMVFARADNVNDVVVGPAASNGFTTPFNAAADKVKVKPGGALILIAPDANGYAVTAGSGDLLSIANGGGGSPVNYDVILIGA